MNAAPNKIILASYAALAYLRLFCHFALAGEDEEACEVIGGLVPGAPMEEGLVRPDGLFSMK